MDRKNRPRSIVIGISMGGVGALKQLLGELPPDFPVPILIVQHLEPNSGDSLAHLLDAMCPIHVKEADEQEVPQGGTVYLAPPNYHLVVEPDGRLGLTVDPAVNYARPSIDVLFETAAEAFGPDVVGIILTGAGYDGSHGLQRIREKGGLTIVQNPEDAVASSMPKQALLHVRADHVVPLTKLPQLLIELSQKER